MQSNFFFLFVEILYFALYICLQLSDLFFFETTSTPNLLFLETFLFTMDFGIKSEVFCCAFQVPQGF